MFSQKKDEQKKLLILDVSSLVYRAYHALPELTVAGGMPAGAVYGFIAILLKELRERKPTHLAAAIDLPGKTFRHDVYAAYKATRPPTPEDLIAQFETCQEALTTLGVPILAVERYEADDVIATLVAQTRRRHPDAEIEILSSDADILQLVDAKTAVIAPRRGATDVSVLTPKGVQEKLGVPPGLVTAFKALRGDPSDNIPGVPGIGPKTAVMLLRHAGSLPRLVAYAKELPNDAPKELQRFAAVLVRHEEAIARSEALVTLKSDASVSFDFASSRIGDALPPAFTAFLKRLGFESLVRRATGKPARSRSGDLVGTTQDRESFLRSQEVQVTAEIDALKAAGIFSHEIAELESRLISVISSMQRRGIGVDQKELTRLRERFHEKREALGKKIFAFAGHDFNLASPKQMADVLFSELAIQSRKKTAGGKRSTAADVLEDLRHENPVVENILAWREVTKLLTTYVDALPKLVDPTDGRIHAKFWQLGTTTGRIASSEPNLQNIPMRTEDGRAVRNAFCAAPGKTFLAADYSQIELRVAAVLSTDEAMLDIFRRDDDAHAATAQKVFHVDVKGVTPEMRRRAKILNFGILYGMGPKRVSREIGVSFAEAQAFLDEYFAAFPTLSVWMERTKERARQSGYTETAFGRRRLFPEMTSPHAGIRSAAERAVINAPIQGTAADLVKRGMVALAQNLSQAPIVVQVHDEILCELSAKDARMYVPHMRTFLEGVWPEAPIAFPVRVSCGERWGTMEVL